MIGEFLFDINGANVAGNACEDVVGNMFMSCENGLNGLLRLKLVEIVFKLYKLFVNGV